MTDRSDVVDPPPPPYSKDVPEGHAAKNGISPEARRSMEDEARPLPDGWVRQYDPERQHQFFVNTRADPPRSIWHHPLDDEDYLATLDPSEREGIKKLRRTPTDADVEAASTDDEADAPGPSKPGPSGAGAPEVKSQGKQSFGRRWKDKLTGTTHEERQRNRAIRAEEERKAYEAHLQMRRALQRAYETGQPQFVGKDRQGHDIYIEPPQQYGGYGGGYGYGPPPGSARGYNPYAQGPYADPNARFVRPPGPYGRPYGSGYGGGLGLPLAGGLAGGLLLGGLLGGGF